jgi:hypothetical protein
VSELRCVDMLDADSKCLKNRNLIPGTEGSGIQAIDVVHFCLLRFKSRTTTKESRDRQDRQAGRQTDRHTHAHRHNEI